MTRTIAVVTGTRAEYGLLRSTMEEIQDAEDFNLVTVATGMHLSPQHGYTIDNIRADGFHVEFAVEMLFRGDTGASMARSLGVGITGLTQAFEQIQPDIVLVLGDRDEAFAAGVAAAHMLIPVAHIHGGDAMTGATIDDSIRHALTKFAHIHFPATRKSADRIERLGEEPWRITPIGAPGLDHIRRGEYVDSGEMRARYGIDSGSPFVLVVQHPETTRPDSSADQMRATLRAIEQTDVQSLVVHPNADAGSEAMVQVIESYTDDAQYSGVKNLPRDEYLGLLAAADVMIGNSSSGIIEAPSFNLPVVNLGTRQEGRERSKHVVDAPFDSGKIAEGITKCVTDESVREAARTAENPYDYGGASKRILERLREIEIDERLLQKQITY